MADEEERLERYLVFSGYDYYPSGGWWDFNSSYSDKEEAISVAKELGATKSDTRWAQVIDKETGGLAYG